MTNKQKSITSPSSHSIFDSVKQGFGFGTGIEVAKGMVSSIIPKGETQTHTDQDEKCKPFMHSMRECMMYDHIEYCYEEINAYKKCINKDKL